MINDIDTEKVKNKLIDILADYSGNRKMSEKYVSNPNEIQILTFKDGQSQEERHKNI